MKHDFETRVSIPRKAEAVLKSLCLKSFVADDHTEVNVFLH